MFPLISFIFSLVAVSIPVGKAIKDSNFSPSPDTESPVDTPADTKAELRKRIQKNIYKLLSDPYWVNVFAHIKTGGADGMPAEIDTFRTVVCHKALEMEGLVSARPMGQHDFHLWNDDFTSAIYDLTGGPSIYNYPGENLITNEDTTGGFERDRPNFFESLLKWVEDNIPKVVELVTKLISEIDSEPQS